ncbi:unnamed protein product [Brassica oleracea var. botrytis]|uniref:Uncharacterized protein n=2 Tax=Brassica TaxID=3705 RepID=A0A3P6E7S6_BRAOL|nr:unnamed protein product [Brassica napus]VDD31414.1 unnamed protein product [Brassica oleracea]
MRLFHDTKSRKGIESNSPHARATSRLFPHLFLASSSSFRLHLSSVVFAGQSLHGFHRKPSNRLCPRPAELNLLGVMRREEEEIARSMSSIIRIFVVKKLRDFCCVEFIPFETFSKHLFHYKDFHHLSRD